MAPVSDDILSMYRKSNHIESLLPYRSDTKNVVISAVDVSCSECNGKGEHLRGRFVEWPNCIELCGLALCSQCETIIRFSVRWYQDGSTAVFSDDGWIPLTANLDNTVKYQWVKKIGKIFRKIVLPFGS